MSTHPLCKTRRANYAICMTAVALMALISACGTSGQKTGSGNEAGSAKAVSAAQAAVKKYSAPITNYPKVPAIPGGIGSLKGKNLWYVPLGGSLPIFQGFGAGIKEAAQAAGMSFHTCDGKLVPTTMVSCLNQAATQGADAVIGGYIDYSEAPTAYDNLISHHIPVVIGGEPQSGGKTNSKDIAFYDATKPDQQAVRVALDSVIADSKGQAHILFMGISDTKSTTSVAQTSKSYIKKACPQCTFNLVMYNTASLSKVPSLASAALISNPETNYVVVQVDSGEPATIQGVQSAGFANKVKLVAISGTLQPLQDIKSGGHQLADVGLSPVYTGWQWTDSAVRMLLGHEPVFTPPVIRLFTKDNVSKLTLTPAAFASNDWYGPDSYRNSFRQAWGLE